MPVVVVVEDHHRAIEGIVLIPVGADGVIVLLHADTVVPRQGLEVFLVPQLAVDTAVIT